MKKLLVIVLSIFAFSNLYSQDDCNCPNANRSSVELTRSISKDIFDLNGVPFMQPLVQAINATSNARFFTTAEVPVKVESPYFRVSLNGMFGSVTDDMRSYVPQLPQEKFEVVKVLPFVSTTSNTTTQKLEISKLDTLNLVRYLFKSIVYDGINGTNDGTGITKGSLKTPERAATVLGKSDAVFELPQNTMQSIAKNRVDFLNSDPSLRALSGGNDIINKALQDTINNILAKLPGVFTLPPGGDYRFLAAGVPQLEIGSWYGTEALIRFVPKVNLGTNIGDFAFYGFGLKHNINQYLSNPKEINIAVQAVYQYTDLENSVGVTNSKLKATGNIYNFNVQVSKSIDGWFDIYTGLGYDYLDIDSKFTYTLSQETMVSLGLIQYNTNWDLPPTDPNYEPKPAKFPASPGYPGDTRPQTTSLSLQESSFKFILGLRKDIGNFAVFFDSNFSKFTVFSGGISYKF